MIRLPQPRRWRRQWLAYVPLAFYVLWLMLRYRSATLYTAANPGIPTGGMTGESKSAILGKLAAIDGLVLDFVLVPPGLAARARLRLARRWIGQRGVPFPLVLKPDVGERGRAVQVVHTQEELARGLLRLREATIVQRFMRGLEFGILYRRMPGEARGHVVSLAQMSHPESGFESHRATYADRRELVTAQLEERVDAISRAHPGFFIGRFDVRAASAGELGRGRFQVMELNGVASEPMHIYDPAVSIAEALRVLRRQARDAFQIGAANRARGAAPTPAATLLRLIAREHAIHVAAAFRRSLG